MGMKLALEKLEVTLEQKLKVNALELKLEMHLLWKLEVHALEKLEVPVVKQIQRVSLLLQRVPIKTVSDHDQFVIKAVA